MMRLRTEIAWLDGHDLEGSKNKSNVWVVLGDFDCRWYQQRMNTLSSISILTLHSVLMSQNLRNRSQKLFICCQLN